VSRIDRATRQVARIFVDDGPSALVPRDNDVWVGHAFADTLSQIDTRSNTAPPEIRRVPVSHGVEPGASKALGKR
jgi:hypothetical protein